MYFRTVLIIEVPKFYSESPKMCSNTYKNNVCKIWSRLVNPNACPKLNI